jgi:hypothetical protein
LQRFGGGGGKVRLDPNLEPHTWQKLAPGSFPAAPQLTHTPSRFLICLFIKRLTRITYRKGV